MVSCTSRLERERLVAEYGKFNQLRFQEPDAFEKK